MIPSVRAVWASLDRADRLVVTGAGTGILGAALTAGIGAGLLFASAVCFGSVALHIWAEVRQ